MLVLLARVPGSFLGVDLDERALHAHVPANRVEDEEFGFRTEVGGVAHASGLHVGLGALGQRTRIALVGLAIARLDDVAGQDQRRLFEERVDVGRVRVRHQLHVRRFDALPAGDRRTVERMAGDELVFVEVRDRHGNVLFLATGIGETEVNELDFVFLHQLHHVGDGLGHQRAPNLFGDLPGRRTGRPCQAVCQGNKAGSVPRKAPRNPGVWVARQCGSRTAIVHSNLRTLLEPFAHQLRTDRSRSRRCSPRRRARQPWPGRPGADRRP